MLPTFHVYGSTTEGLGPDHVGWVLADYHLDMKRWDMVPTSLAREQRRGVCGRSRGQRSLALFRDVGTTPAKLARSAWPGTTRGEAV